MKKLNFLTSTALVFSSFLALQTLSSQAMDTMAISLTQPDGIKKAMKLNLDQPLSELRTMLIHKGIRILPDDKFFTEMGEISPREEGGWTVREVVVGKVLSFKSGGSKELAIDRRSLTPYSLPVFLAVQKANSTEDIEKNASFSGREFSQETPDTLEPNIFLQQNLKRDVERRRSLDSIMEPNMPIMKQDASPRKAEPHLFSKLKEQKGD